MIRLTAFLIAALFLLYAPSAGAETTSDGGNGIGPQVGLILAQASGGQRLIAPRQSESEPRTERAGQTNIGWWTRFSVWIRMQQQSFYRQLSGELRAIRDTSSFAAIWGLALVSFLYGIFHAAGPGHGKAVISAYLFANERQLKRGIQLAFLSSFFQAMTAIILVSGLLLIADTVFRSAQSMTRTLELLSYALVAALGLYLLWRALSHAVPRRRAGSVGAAAVEDYTHHAHHREDHHDHGPDCGCGHEHIPAASRLDGEWSITRALSIALAVGIRPCAGAIVVLVFAAASGIYLAGIGATFAMALGTAITVSAIAILAVTSRGLALRLTGGSPVWFRRASVALGVLGGITIFAIGAVLFAVTYNAPQSFI